MSVKREYETKTYTKTEKVMVSEKCYCDICEKEITGHHWHILTGHNDWGNDSCESIETFDICSEACLREVFENYIKESNDDYNTQYIEVRHMRHSGVKGEINYDTD